MLGLLGLEGLLPAIWDHFWVVARRGGVLRGCCGLNRLGLRGCCGRDELVQGCIGCCGLNEPVPGCVVVVGLTEPVQVCGCTELRLWSERAVGW